MKVRYSRRALADINGIADHLNSRNRAGAAKVRDAIRATIRRLGQFHLSGRLQDDGSRKAVALPCGYLI